MSGFYDKFVSRDGVNARYAHNAQDAGNDRRGGIGALAVASIIAVPLLMAGWPEHAYSQAVGGAEGGVGNQGNQGNQGKDTGDAGGGGGSSPDGGVAGAMTSGASDVSGIMGGEGGERVIIIDVRPRADFAKGHLKNAKNVEVRYSPVLRDHVFDTSALGADKSARIVVYGANANDPAAAAVVRQAQAEGFSNVIWMRGGFAEWIAARLPTTQG